MINTGKILIFLGIALLVLGGILLLFGEKLNWFGNTSMDFKYEQDNVHFYFPLGSMLILSLLLSIVINIILKIFK